jgi:hypothetical protein
VQPRADLARVNLDVWTVHHDLRAAWAHPRVIVKATSFTIPYCPEALPEGSHLGTGGAEHYLGPVDSDIAPALAQLAVAAQGHMGGRKRQVGAVPPGPTPRELDGGTHEAKLQQLGSRT